MSQTHAFKDNDTQQKRLMWPGIELFCSCLSKPS